MKDFKQAELLLKEKLLFVAESTRARKKSQKLEEGLQCDSREVSLTDNQLLDANNQLLEKKSDANNQLLE